MALIENEMVVSWSYFIKPLKSNIWLLPPPPAHGTLRRVVLFALAGPTVKAAFQQLSSHPRVPKYSFVSQDSVPSSTRHWGQCSRKKKKKSLKVSQIPRDVRRPCRAWAHGRERAAVRTFPTWDGSVTWCAVRPVILSTWDTWWVVLSGVETGNQCDSQCSR